ncbi:MAG: hypothetical protein E6614_06615, partial [Bradyrhizobium sp.]|nr:hypothetical protein [Bradyrhizobium sp.]
ASMTASGGVGDRLINIACIPSHRATDDRSRKHLGQPKNVSEKDNYSLIRHGMVGSNNYQAVRHV